MRKVRPKTTVLAYCLFTLMFTGNALAQANSTVVGTTPTAQDQDKEKVIDYAEIIGGIWDIADDNKFIRSLSMSEEREFLFSDTIKFDAQLYKSMRGKLDIITVRTEEGKSFQITDMPTRVEIWRKKVIENEGLVIQCQQTTAGFLTDILIQILIGFAPQVANLLDDWETYRHTNRYNLIVNTTKGGEVMSLVFIRHPKKSNTQPTCEAGFKEVKYGTIAMQ